MLRVTHPPTWIPERRYVLDCLLGEMLGLGFSVEFGDTPGTQLELPGGRLVVHDGFFALPEERHLSEAMLPGAPLRTSRLDVARTISLVSDELPILFGSAPLANVSAGRIDLRLDVFGGAFFLMTRYEEAVKNRRDEHGRFPALECTGESQGVLDRAVVDEYVEVLWWGLHSLFPRLPRRARTFRLLPSHDVDWPFSRRIGSWVTLRSAAADLLVRRDARLALHRIASPFLPHDADVLNTFDFVMDASEARGLTSSFYFIAAAG